MLYFLLGLLLVILLALVVLALMLRSQRLRSIRENSRLLLIEVPKDNDKSPLSAEQLFASIHGLYRNFWQRLWHGRVFLSFEIEAQKDMIRFYLHVPAAQEEFVTKQIYAQYPAVKMRSAKDYIDIASSEYLAAEHAVQEIVFQKPYYFPIRTFANFEVDPLSAITSSLSGLGPKERIWFQMIVTPVSNKWQRAATDFAGRIRQGQAGLVGHVTNSVFQEIMHVIFIGIPRAIIFNKTDYPDKQAPNMSDAEQSAIKHIQEKATKLGFSVKLRLWALAETKPLAQQRIREFVSTLQQFTMTNLNGFKVGGRVFNAAGFKEKFRQRRSKLSKLIMNIEELASLYHLPDQNVETPSILWSRSRKGEPPPNLPVTSEEGSNRDLTIFASTDFRHESRKFGIKQKDRLRHLYVIGKTGMGKSTMLSNMAIDDVRSGRGVAVVDPHGDLIETVLDYIPKRRINDVILFDPSDTEFPLALNMLEAVDPAHKTFVASGLISVFYKMYADSWGPRLEHILRNTILALLDAPDSTMIGITRMLSDEGYRRQVVARIQNPTVAMFWRDEFPKLATSRSASETLGAVQNKVGQFLSIPTVRNIIGQTHSSIDIRKIMDEQKILLVNLSKGRLGEDVSALLGSMLISKIQLAAMSRADIPEEKRIPFHLFVDEFQNFATSSFATILSEARKYKLGLTMANQYIAQMPEDVRAAVFGNVGTLVAFSVGATDAAYIEKEFSPVFIAEDVTHLDRYNVYLRMTIDGINSEPYSAITLPLPVNRSDNREKILNASRERYASAVTKVETSINKQSGFHMLKPVPDPSHQTES